MTTQSLYRELQEADLPSVGWVLNVPELGGILIAWGTAAPADGTAGYARGGLFIVTTSGAAAWYVNQGTTTSCDFDAVTIA